MRQMHNFIPSAALMATVLLGGCTDVGNDVVRPGDCKFTKYFPDGVGNHVVQHLVRSSELTDGIWTDRVTYDPACDSEQRSDLLEESRFSVDARGVTLGMERLEYRDGAVIVSTLEHLKYSASSED